MKSVFLAALAGLIAAPSALAATRQPLVSKSNGSGYVPAEYSRYETCEVFLNQVVVTQRFGYPEQLGFTKREVRPISLDRSILKVVEEATKEEVQKKDNYLCDAPSTSMSFHGTPEPLTLFSSGGCGSPRLERQGPASEMLKELVNQYCPVTHDYGNRN